MALKPRKEKGGLQLENNSTLDLFESSASGTSKITLKGPASLASDTDYILPEDGSNGEFLSTDGSGNLSWAAPSNLETITTQSANYTALTSDQIIAMDATSSALTLTLYAASGNSGRILKVKHIGTAYNAVTIDANASEEIDGETTQLLLAPNDEMTIICDGTGWLILNEKLEPIKARAFRSGSGQTIANGTETRIDFNGETYDDFSVWDAATNYRFQPTRAGKFLVQTSVAYPSPNDGTRLTTVIRKNGTIVNRVNTVSAGAIDTGTICFGLIELSTSDYIDVAVSQNSGGSEDISDGTNDTFIEVTEIR